MKSNLAGLYIQIEAKKRRIRIINSGNRPETAHRGHRSCTRKYFASAEYSVPRLPSSCHPEARALCGPKDLWHLSAARFPGGVHGFFASLRMTSKPEGATNPLPRQQITGAVTSC